MPTLYLQIHCFFPVLSHIVSNLFFFTTEPISYYKKSFTLCNSVYGTASWCYASDSNPYPKGSMAFNGKVYPNNDYAFQTWVALGV